MISRIFVISSAILAFCCAPMPADEGNVTTTTTTEAGPPPSGKEAETLGAPDEEGFRAFGEIRIHPETGVLTFPAHVNMTEGLVELIACTAKGRTHESLLVTEIDPFRLQFAMILAGGVNGPRSPEQAGFESVTRYRIELQANSGPKRNIVEFIVEDEGGLPFPETEWVFVGSAFLDARCLASTEGNLIDINSLDDNTILGAPNTDAYRKKWFVIDSKRVASFGLHGSAPDKTPSPVNVFLIPVSNRIKQ